MVATRTQISLLVVDDDARTHAALEELFALSDYAVRTAHNAEEALDELRRRPASAMITEVALPGMDGLTLVRQARRIDPSIAALVLTRVPSARAASRALRLDCDDYLIKHADSIGHLREAVRTAIKRRARRTEIQHLFEELAALNDQFLRTMVEMQKRNLDLEAALRPPSHVNGPFRVLVVDDDVAIVRLLEAALGGEPGLQMTGALSGRQALQALEEAGPFDLVMTDKNLGDANGVEIVRRVHDTQPDTDVLLMTGFATLDSAVQAMDHGAVAYLRKPFDDIGAVIDKVREIREKQRERREQSSYLHAVKSQNVDFLNRYRLIKAKLVTLQQQEAAEP